jgi:hypothetical protein
MTRSRKPFVYQFKITLEDVPSPVWRRIHVPVSYSFWDLHVAIQDSMGWLDYHLHAFLMRRPGSRKEVEIGIPEDEYESGTVFPGWEIAITDYFKEPGQSAIYQYDFGDNWTHSVVLEGILLKEEGVTYPRCLAGEHACPPEDCGGPGGFEHFLRVIKDPKHEEYKDTIAWLKEHAINYYPYTPDAFDPDTVEFWDPKKRWKMAISSR